MIHRTRSARNRDLALTTLIDLLVQIIFVFTLILISADVMGSESREPGWVAPEAWKTLISIFDVDPRHVREPNAQVAAIKDKYKQLQDDLAACETKSSACDKQAGRGPGYATCRDASGVEMVVADAIIDSDGRIVITPGRHARELLDRQPLGAGAIGAPLSAEQFASLFRPWRERGLARSPSCAFKVEVRYDARTLAGDYEPARRAIASYFTFAAAPKPF